MMNIDDLMYGGWMCDCGHSEDLHESGRSSECTMCDCQEVREPELDDIYGWRA
jgi:hypothetical protein